MKNVLNVGQCLPDHSAILHYLTANFDVSVDQAALPDDTLAALRRKRYDLVLINRKLDEDYSDGIEILHAIKQDDELRAIPVMLVTNYPEHQAASVAAGGVPGFGKDSLRSSATADLLRPYLG